MAAWNLEFCPGGMFVGPGCMNTHKSGRSYASKIPVKSLVLTKNDCKTAAAMDTTWITSSSDGLHFLCCDFPYQLSFLQGCVFIPSSFTAASLLIQCSCLSLPGSEWLRM